MTLVVRASELVRILNEDGVEIRKEKAGWDNDRMLTPLQRLVEKGVCYRRLWSILHSQQNWVSFNVADRILCALGRPEAFHTGELEVLDICVATGRLISHKSSSSRQKRKNEKQERNKRIVSLHLKGLNGREIARKEGLSHPRVSQILKAMQCS